MSKTLWIGIGLFVAVVVIAVVAFGRAKTPTTETPVSASPTPQAVSSPTQTEGGVKEIQVVASEYSFEPATISLNKGDNVSLTFRNTGNFPHNLTIDGLGLSTKTIDRGESDTISFVAESSGIFSFYCSVGNHRGLGMEGSLEVK